MLYVNNLFKQYGNFTAVSNLNLHVPKGDLFGFVGPNGAGKTTTIRIICGLLKATSGEVIVNGASGAAGMMALKRTIGYVPDFFGVYDNLKVKEYLEFYGSLYGMSYKETEGVADGLLDLVNLADKKEVYVDTLSRGMKQRLCVARALLHNPELLVMDEPSSGLDPGARVEMKELLMNLQSMGKTIVISSHILADISEMCNSIGIMNHGQLVAAGLMKDILSIGNDASRLIIEVKSDIEQAVTIMREQPNVQIEAVKSNEIIVTGVDTDEMANSLVGQLMVRGVLVGGFHRDEHSLESIFMDITEGRAGGVNANVNPAQNGFGGQRKSCTERIRRSAGIRRTKQFWWSAWIYRTKQLRQSEWIRRPAGIHRSKQLWRPEWLCRTKQFRRPEWIRRSAGIHRSKQLWRPERLCRTE